MPLYGRERDFTSATLDDIRSNLKGDSSLYTDLSRWWNAYGEAFDFVDPTADIHYLENYMSEVRYFMIESAPRALDTIETNIRQLDADYAAKTDEIKSELTTYISAVDTLIEAIQDPHFATNFNKDATLDKIRLVAPQIVANNNARSIFVDDIMAQYGFDRRTAETMWRIQQVLKVRYPYYTQEQLDWKFSRVISALSYPGNVGEYSELEQLMFNSCAGYAFDGMSEEYYYVTVLGMSHAEYLRFRYKVRIQNYLSAPDHVVFASDLKRENFIIYKKAMETALGRTLTDEEFAVEWNNQVQNMGGKTDFAHHMYIIASNLAVDLGLTLPAAVAFGDADGIKEMTGWLGDAVLPPYSFGPDDYKADLDAFNILYYMSLNGWSYQQASAWYYTELQKGRLNRATVFLLHTPLSEVEKKILSKLKLTSMDQVREQYPDTYNFYSSLRQRQNEMVG